MAVPELLDALLRAHGPAGHEHLAFDVVRAAVGDSAEIETDTVGNLFARRRGKGPLLGLFAHLDVIGLAVSHIGEDGRLSVHKLGGFRANVAYGQRIEIRTKAGAVPGVVARSVKDDEKVEWTQLYVDIGARDAAEAATLVAVGDPMVFLGEPLELHGGRLTSRSLDDRAGVYVALEAVRRLEDANVAAVASAQEELGHHGARTAAYAIEPEVAITIDVTYATDVPGDDPATGGDHRLGGGPAIYRGPLVNPRVFGLLTAAAEQEGIPFTVEVGQDSYSDADDTFISRAGIATGLVSIPLRNMHSPIEIVQLDDLEACIRLLVAFARKLEPGASYAR